jgi:salicylate hydroxylase
MRFLKKYNPSASPPSTELLSKVFTDYQDLRLPRTSELVRRARRQGEIRVVEGTDACRARDEAIQARFNDEAERRAHDELLSEPFKFKDNEI